MTKPRIVGEYLHRKTMELMEQGAGDYWQCHHQVLDNDRELKLLYAGLAGEVRGPQIKPKGSVTSPSESFAAGSELHNLVVKFIHDMNLDLKKGYEWSLKQILKSNPGQARKYIQT